MTNTFVGSVEAGGTKFVLAVADENNQSVAEGRIPTTTPEETLQKSVEFFKEHPVAALGVASFGPVDINPNSKTNGYILKLSLIHI